MTTDPERATTDDVRIWKTEKDEGKKATTNRVWRVIGRRSTARASLQRPAVDSFLSDPMSAHRRAESFDAQTGRPIAQLRVGTPKVSWNEFACYDAVREAARPIHLLSEPKAEPRCTELPRGGLRIRRGEADRWIKEHEEL